MGSGWKARAFPPVPLDVSSYLPTSTVGELAAIVGGDGEEVEVKRVAPRRLSRRLSHWFMHWVVFAETVFIC